MSRPAFVFVRCVLCDEEWGDVDVDPVTGLCFACRIELAERPQEEALAPAASLQEDVEAARLRAIERHDAWLAELKERMARRRALGLDAIDEQPRRTLGRAQLGRAER